MILGKLKTLYNFRVKPKVSNIPGAFYLNRKLGLAMNYFVERPEGEEFSPFEKDWDVLIILDACRYDYYEGFFPESSKRVTRASHSREYFGKNFSSGSYYDIVYISANGHISPENFREATGRDLDEVFYKVDHLALSEWDDGLGIVPPEAATDKALEEEDKNPERKKVVHYMQPHAPYIDEEETWGFRDFLESEMDIKDLREAYSGNIRMLIPEIKRLAENMSGKIVVTADHGELLGGV